MESVEILITLRPQQAGNLGEGLPPPDMRKGEICQMFRNFQEWMETAVASLAKQAARRISALIKDSDGTNEESRAWPRCFLQHYSFPDQVLALLDFLRVGRYIRPARQYFAIHQQLCDARCFSCAA